MWCVERWVLLAMLSGCSFVNRIDTCDAPKAVETQVNALTSGDQIATPGMAVARLTSGGYVAVWVSRTGTVGDERSEVRATLLSKEGKQVPPCGSAQGDIAVSVKVDAQVVTPVVAAGLTQDGPIYIAWTQQDAGETKKTIQLRLLTQDLCKWAISDPQTVTASEPGEDNVSPALAVRTDGRQALLSWLAFTDGTTTLKLRVRPVGPDIDSAAAHWLHDNGCDGSPTSCVVNEDLPLGPPVATATANGYALAWSGPRDDGAAGWQVRLLALNKNGTPGIENTGKRQFGPAQRLYLALSANSSQLLLAAAIENGSNLNEVDRGVFTERLVPKRLIETDLTSEALVSIGLDPQLATARVDPPSGVLLFESGQAIVSWTSELAGSVNELRGTIIDEFDTVMFNGLACDATDFAWPVARGSNEGLSSSLAGNGSTVLHVFHSALPVPGGNDTLGTSVHALNLDFKPLVPLLK
jgi:hypothetical protein